MNNTTFNTPADAAELERRANLSREEVLEEIREADAVAEATPCDVEGCDRSFHNGTEPPEKWVHHIDGGALMGKGTSWAINVFEGRARVEIEAQFDYDLDAEGVRELAEWFAGVPDHLRGLADELDRRNG